MLAAVAVAFLIGAGCDRQGAKPTDTKELTAFVPCGMVIPFTEARKAFEAQNPGVQVNTEFDNAHILVKRIADKGEHPDIVVSPGAVEMDALVKAGLVDRKDVTHFGRYELMLFAPRENPGEVEDFQDLLKPEVKVIAVADPAHNSVGRYTKQALEKLGLWEKLQPKIELTDHPITAYKWVAQVKAQASFAYRSCPLESAPEKLSYSKVRILKSVPRDLYDPAYATMAILKDSRRRALAGRFVAFLDSEEGRKLLVEYGVPNPVELNIFVPCGMYGRLFELKTLYERQNPAVLLDLTFDRIDKLTERIVKNNEMPDLHLSIGGVETDLLVKAGRVNPSDVLPIGRFRLALCAHVSLRGTVTKVEDLARPEVKRIVLAPPENSSVGFYARESLTRLGVWEKVKDKIAYLPTIKDCHKELSAGKADAGFGYIGCPITIDPEKAEYSKVIAVQTMDEETYGGAVANASLLTGSRYRTEALAFARFLGTPEAQAVLRRGGLEPLEREERKEENADVR